MFARKLLARQVNWIHDQAVTIFGHPVIAGLVSCVMVIVALLISDFVIGTQVVVPLLEQFIEARRESGESVGAFEAITVFVIVMTYMLIITLLVGIAALSGWVLSRLALTKRFSLGGIIQLFSVAEPD